MLDGLRVSMMYGKALRLHDRGHRSDAREVLQRAMLLVERQAAAPDWAWVYGMQVAGLLAMTLIEDGQVAAGLAAVERGRQVVHRSALQDPTIRQEKAVQQWEAWAIEVLSRTRPK
jgi:hypothetical protein